VHLLLSSARHFCPQTLRAVRRRGRGIEVFVVRLSFALPELHVREWARAAVRDLKERGYSFPNLTPGRQEPFDQLRAQRWSDLSATLGQPVFEEEVTGADGSFAQGGDLRVVALHLDAPSSCALWKDAEPDVLVRLCKVVMRRFDYLRDLVPEVRAAGPWLALVDNGKSEPFYATEVTTVVRRGNRPS